MENEQSKPAIFSRLVEYLAGKGRLTSILAEGDPAAEAAFDAECERLRKLDEENPRTVAGWRERE